MPTLRFHAVEQAKLQSVSSAMIAELAAMLDIPTDHFNVELIQSIFLDTEGSCAGFPIVEVHAFKRDVAIEDSFAECVSRYMQAAGYAESELYFIHLEPRHYYFNGKHY